MDLHPEVLRKLNGQQFEALMQRLITVEGLAAGLPLGGEGISFRLDGRGDGGVDALVFAEPLTPTPHIKRRTVFQAKRSYDLSKLKSQLKKPAQQRARTLLQNGAGYTLVVCEEVDAEELEELSAMLKQLVGKTVPTELLSIEHVMQWLIQHPQLLISVPGLEELVPHLRSFEDWEKNFVELLPWTPDESRLQAIARIQNLRSGEHLRISGLAGVGKTRTVLEALRSRAAEVTYVPEYVVQVERLVSSATPVRGVLVVDECSTDQHRKLLRLHHSGVTLITIGVEVHEASVANEMSLLPLDPETMHRLALRSGRNWFLQDLAQHSGGFPKFFALLLEAAKRAEVEDLTRTSLNRRDVSRILDRLLNSDGRLDALQVLATPLWLDVSESSRDFEVLSAAIGANEAALLSAYEALKSRSLIGRLNHRAYVTPQILAEHLALGFWGSAEHVSRRFESLLSANADTELMSRCVARMESGSAPSAGVLDELARHPELLSRGLDANKTVDLLARLARQDPFSALIVAREWLDSAPTSWPSGFKDVLAELSAHPDSFEGAVQLIVRMLEGAESTQFGLLTDVFVGDGGLTRASTQQRLDALCALAASKDERVRLLAAHCAHAACGRQISFERRRHPNVRAINANRDNEDEYDRRALTVLGSLLRDDSLVVRSAAEKFTSALIRISAANERYDTTVSAIQQLVEAGSPLDVAREEVARFRELDVERLGNTGSEWLAKFEMLLVPRNLQELLSHEFESERCKDSTGETPQVVELATQLLASRDDDALRFLFRCRGPGPVSLGEAVGRLDVDESFPQSMTELARRPDADLGFLVGYFYGRGCERAAALLDTWAVPSGLGRVVVRVSSQVLPFDGESARRVRLLVERGELSVDALDDLTLRYSKADDEARQTLRPLFLAHPRVWFEFVRLSFESDEVLSKEFIEAWSLVAISLDGNVPHFDYYAARVAREAPSVVRSVLFQLAQRDFHLPFDLLNVAHLLTDNWKEFTSLLESLDERALFRLSVSLHGQLRSLRAEPVLEWVGDSRSRACLMVAFAPPAQNTESSVAAALLDKFPGDESLMETAGFYRSGVVITGGLDHERRRLELVHEFVASKRPGLVSLAEYLRPRVEVRIRHDETELRAEQHGVSAWRRPDESVSHAVYKLAESQLGYFSAEQAKKSGCSAQLLRRYQQTGKVLRLRRSIYRLREFPQSPYEDLMVLWLWSERRGVFSHSTALSLHGLSSLMPDTYEMTMPARHQKRRLTVPESLTLHFAELPKDELVELHSVWATSVKRTLADCAAAGIDEDVLRDAREAARARGLVS